MFEKSKYSQIFFWSLEVLIVALFIFVCTKISFLFSPIGIFIQTVFMPILISGFLFYLLNPIVGLIKKIKIKNFKMPHTLAVAIVLLVMFLGLTIVVLAVVPNLVTQVSRLLVNLPNFTTDLQKQMDVITSSKWIKQAGVKIDLKSLESSFGKYAQLFLLGTANGLGTVIAKITSFTVTAITVPVMLFYMLNDGHKLMPTIKKLFQKDKADKVEELLGQMSKTISQYIDGQVIECLFVGVFTSIGYFIINQPYALLLGVIAGIANIIPYVGPYIGIFPALIVAITINNWQILWVIIVVIVVQQVDGNLIYPNIIGKTLKIHPLTIIIILLAAGNIAGIGGMILAIPFYAVVRTVVAYAWHIWQVQQITNDTEPKI